MANSAISNVTLTEIVSASGANPTAITMSEAPDNGTNKVTLTVPASLSGDVTVSLPSTAGSLALAADIPTVDVTPTSTTTLTNKTLDAPTMTGAWNSSGSTSIQLNNQGYVAAKDLYAQGNGTSTNGRVFLVNANGSFQGNLTVNNNTADRSWTLPDASGNVVLDTATQTLTNKTLDSPALSGAMTGASGAGITLTGANFTTNEAVTGNALNAIGNGSLAGSITLSNAAQTGFGTIAVGTLTGTKTWTLPNLSGTFAMLSDVGTPAAAATQAELETATSTSTFVSPGTQQYHPSAAKFWVLYTTITTTSITQSYNVASLTDNGTGDTTINYTTAFSSANYSVTASNQGVTVGTTCISMVFTGGDGAPQAPSTSACRIGTVRVGVGPNDTTVCVTGYGDQ